MSASASEQSAVARRALPLLDLTDLSDRCSISDIHQLCRTARHAGVAAVCIWPQFVGEAAQLLGGSAVALATVVNFPAGDEGTERVVGETQRALADGADEIDVVMPYRAFLRGHHGAVSEMVLAVRAVCDQGRCLKVILETGALGSPAEIATAARLALDSGADFVKTSTGKISLSATPEAAEAMLQAVRVTGHGGLKVSGGLRTIADAAAYLALADRIMGPDWVTPKTFRLGASSLYSALEAALEAKQ